MTKKTRNNLPETALVWWDRDSDYLVSLAWDPKLDLPEELDAINGDTVGVYRLVTTHTYRTGPRLDPTSAKG